MLTVRPTALTVPHAVESEKDTTIGFRPWFSERSSRRLTLCINTTWGEYRTYYIKA